MGPLLFFHRAYADAGPSVRHSERAGGEEADFVRDAGIESEKSVESTGGGEEEKDEEGKKKKPRSGFRDRKVINKIYVDMHSFSEHNTLDEPTRWFWSGEHTLACLTE